MGKKKPVNLSSGLTFEAAGKANAYFKKVLNDTPLDQAVSPDNLSNVLALYKDYCNAVPGHDVPHKPINVFRRWNNDERPNGSYVTTSCFYVHFDNGVEKAFSYSKAVSAIANHSG